MSKPTARAMATALSRYHRPKEDGTLETWEEVVDRVIEHQRWLWKRALTSIGKKLGTKCEEELQELRQLILDRKVAPAGRTLWLGGTEIARTRESSSFNCAFCNIESVYDIVDILWLLLQGCGTGFKPIPGTLTGFRKKMREIEVVRSVRQNRGNPKNSEIFDAETKVWTIKVGDSAESWAKAAGKLVAGRFPAEKLVLDFTEIRPAGFRLRGYGWLSSGDEQICKAFKAIAELLSDRADQLLAVIDIIDVVNHLGTILSSRRSAQCALLDYNHPQWRDFALMKLDHHLKGKDHRRQSNNSLIFLTKPSREEISEIFETMVKAGGSEPGIINAATALQRAPWWSGLNPCCEILLGNKSFCCLTEINLLAFRGDKLGLERALRLVARMNYRQTMVKLDDGILQESWHTKNQFLHLCGVGLTGIAAREDITVYDYRRMHNIAVSAAYDMALELDAPEPKNVTTVKPSGTLSKVCSCEEWGEVPEGSHRPMGRYIFNRITYSKYDPLVARFQDAGYSVEVKPQEPESVLVKFPVKFEHLKFTPVKVHRRRYLRQLTTQELDLLREQGSGQLLPGKDYEEREETIYIDTEPAVAQLDRYRMLMQHWCDQNVSTTIYYSVSEIPAIIEWLDRNWEFYVAVSFLPRADAAKTAFDYGYPYLPQEVVSKEEYEEYIRDLKDVDYTDLRDTKWEYEGGCTSAVCESGQG